MKPGRYSTGTVASVAGLICLLIYLRTLGCEFVSYDDPDYVLNNPLIRHLDVHLIVSAFSESYIGWWMPLTWISLAIDYHFWELNPLGYHLTNILFHSLNSGLVVLIAGRVWAQVQGRDSGGCHAVDCPAGQRQRDCLYPLMLLLAGLLWGLHPLRVESVAWITERKDVLNGTFSLASILLYLRYVEGRSGGVKGMWGVYLLSLLMFAMSLMAKSISVVLPLMLLVIDWYPLNRLRNGRVFPVFVEKLPFLLISVAMAIVTIHFTSQVGYLVSYSVFPFTQRLAVSGNALFEYCRLMFYPIGILPFYLIPDPIPVSFTIKTVIFTVAVISSFRVRNSHPWLSAMLLLFVLPLMPVLALFQNGDQALAARFTYLPSLAPTIGAAIAGAVLCSKYLKDARWKYLCGAGALVAVLLYGAVTVTDIAVWQNSLSLWTRVIDHQPEVASYKERGKLYADRGDYRAAVDDFSAAIGMATGVWQRSIYNLYAYRGEAYRSMGRYPEAVQDFTTAISLYPHPVYYHYRGTALQQMGRTTAAADDFAKAGGATGPLDWFERTER